VVALPALYTELLLKGQATLYKLYVLLYNRTPNKMTIHGRKVTQTRFWAIADTHLSFGKPKDMTRFGEKWQDHTQRLALTWNKTIAPNDVVMLAGDISWAHNIPKFEAQSFASWQP
jgi:hypothetical protein